MNYKHYISIMAACCYESESLINIIEEQFILQGGDPQWLVQGLKAVDPKLRALAELNELLAFKPWIIDEDNITYLYQQGWTNQELT